MVVLDGNPPWLAMEIKARGQEMRNADSLMMKEKAKKWNLLGSLQKVRVQF